MSFFRKCVRQLVYPNYRYKSIVSLVNNSSTIHRHVHCTSTLSAKMYKEYENQYAYQILENKGYAISLKNDVESQSLSETQFTNILQEDWSRKSATETSNAFSMLSVYCRDNNVCISNKMFDSYIDTLTDSLKHATDEELKSIFYSLNRWPDAPSIRTRNFIEVWAALDHECLNRCLDWSHDELLCFISLFYMINVTKYSDFCIKALNKLSTKAKQLTPGQLIQTLFFVGVWRSSPFDVHNLEVQLKNMFSKFSIDDLAIMSMGFFKSKTPIRDPDLVLKIINLVIENAKSVHEVSLAALLKVIRYSTKLNLDDRIFRLLDTLQHEVPRLSVMCNVHIAILGTSTLNFHRECLSRIAENVIQKLPQTRIKDLERIVLAYATFNYTPSAKDFFCKIVNELRKPERNDEINGHGRSFACCLSYLSLLQVYPADLINRVLSTEFLDKTYGNVCYHYGKETFVLHYIAQLYCKDTVVSYVTEKTAKILAKKYTDYVPSEDYKKQYNNTERMFLDVLKVLRELRGGPQFVNADHILPYHQRGDIIICDDHNGVPVDINDVFPSKDFGILQKPPNQLIWTVLVIAGRNSLIYGTNTVTGPFSSKIRDLETLGYNATLVPWSIYSKIETVYEKADYLNNLINSCRKNKNK